MPDSSMCGNEECPSAAKCYRHRDSGRAPDLYQWWNTYHPDETGKCDDFMEKWERKDD